MEMHRIQNRDGREEAQRHHRHCTAAPGHDGSPGMPQVRRVQDEAHVQRHPRQQQVEEEIGQQDDPHGQRRRIRGSARV